MKHWITALIFLGIGLLPAYADDARALLEQAIAHTQNASFSTTIPSPFTAKNNANPVIYYGNNWKIYRSVTTDGIKERVDILSDNQLHASYIANEDGIFGRNPDGFCAEILDSQAIGYAKLVCGIPDPAVWKEATFESKPGLYHKIPCVRLLVTVTNSRKTSDKRPTESTEEFQKRQADYMAHAPHTYEYMIGTKDHFIYRKRVFNSRGVVVQELELGDVTLAEQPQELFAVTEQVQGRFLRDIYFYAKDMQRMFAATIKPRGIPWYQKTTLYLYQNGAILGGILGITALVVAVGIKIYQKCRA